MNNEFWKKQAAKKTIKKSFEKQNIKKLHYFVKEGYNIIEVLNLENVLIECAKKNKMHMMKFFLLYYKFSENEIAEAHKYIKKIDNINIEKIFLMYTGEKRVRRKNLIAKYKKIKKKNNYL